MPAHKIRAPIGGRQGDNTGVTPSGGQRRFAQPAELIFAEVARFVRGPGEIALVFLIILIIATAILLGWLLFAMTRLTLGEVRLPRLHPSPAPPGAEARAEPPPIVAAPEPETVLYDELDAERAVREHLYGRRERRT